MKWILLSVMLLTSCTLRIVDDSSDYNIDAKMESDGKCKMELVRTEGKTTGTKNAKVTR